MNRIEAGTDGTGLKLAVVVARFNASVTERLLGGCTAALTENGVAESDITAVSVPGAWELPLACRKLAASGKYDAVVALGCVIRGETAHFEFICAETARGLGQAGLETGVPVAFGVLTAENGDQALERADPARRDKGREAALAALEMARLARVLG